MASSALSSHAPLGPPTTSSPGRDDPGTDRHEPPPRPRPLGRRPALPGGRAVVGGLLVTLAAIGTFVAYTAASAGPTATVIVANRPLVAGDTIHAADLRTEPADLPDAVSDTLFGVTGDLEGAVVLSSIDADQAVPRSAVSTAPSSGLARTHDLSFALDRDRALNGRIRRGELLDLVATFGSGTDATTEVVVRGARVVDLDAPTSAGVASSAKVTVTLALEREADVLRIANAIETASVTLVRSTGTEGDPSAADPAPDPDRGDPIADRPAGSAPPTTTDGSASDVRAGDDGAAAP